MILDRIEKLATQLRIDTTAPPGMKFGYACSYACYVVTLIEQALGVVQPAPGYLGVRVNRCEAIHRLDCLV